MALTKPLENICERVPYIFQRFFLFFRNTRTITRKQPPDVFCKKSCRPETCNFIKKETLAQVFSCEFCKIVKNTFLAEHLRWLLLITIIKGLLPNVKSIFYFQLDDFIASCLVLLSNNQNLISC